MTLIEGIGDEVTIFISLLLILLILCLAWISTNVPDLGGIRVIILDRTNFHRLGEIARRYQIIGYQIISGHVVRNAEHGNREQDDSQSGGEGEEGSEQSGAEDTTREASGDDDSQNNSRAPSQENISQSEPVTTSQVDVVTLNSSEPSTTSLRAEPEDLSTQFTRTSHTSDSHSVERGPHDNSHPDDVSAIREPAPAVASSCSTETLGASSDNVTGSDTNELRKRRLAFYDKADNIESQDGFSHICHDNTPAPSGGDIPADGSSVDGNSQTVNRDIITESAQANSESEPTGQMRIKIKYLDDRQRQVEAKPTETIGEFKRKHFAGELAENMLVRFIYNGRELRHDASTLQSCNITDGSVIHCLLTRGAQPEENSNQQGQDEEFNMGALMFPLFGLILATIWYCRFTYRHYFNAMSTLILVGITLLYMIAGMAMYRHHVDYHHQD